MHTRNLTGPGEHPATDEDYEDELFARCFRVLAGVQQNATKKENRTAHHNRDMKSWVCSE
jgi:hypothetical protein